MRTQLIVECPAPPAGMGSGGFRVRKRLANTLRQVVLLAVAVLAGGACAAPITASRGTSAQRPSPQQGRMFLSWHAPRGVPGATDTLRTACDDSERIDTLYVSVFTPLDLPNVIAMSATLHFSAEGPDSLGPFWDFKSGHANERSMFIEFDLGLTMGCPQPWRAAGSGAVRYDLAGATSELQLEYAIPSEQSIPITPEEQNCVARIRILEKRPHLGGCAQAVRIAVERVRFELLDGGTLEFGPESSSAVFWNPRLEPPAGDRSD